jgi:hypothetical protein
MRRKHRRSFANSKPGFGDINPQNPPPNAPPATDPAAKTGKPGLKRPAVTTSAPAGQYPAPTPEHPPMRTQGESSISTERVTLSVRMRFNPLRGLTADRLVQYLDQFDLGFFRLAAITWDRLERRDYVLKSVIPKRKKAVARHGFEVLTVDNVSAGQEQLAQQQADALKYFFNNLTATDALKPDQVGGIALLARQMMDAQGKFYAVHEIVWQPKPEGLTAQFVFCPLWWFEGVTGKLRYLDNEFQVYGRDMNPSEWLITCGEGLMESCSVAWMLKHLPTQDLLNLCERYGQPFIDAATSASPGSDDWEKLVEYVQDFGADGGGVRSQSATVSLIEAKSTSAELFKLIIENMDRALTILWRGGDLGTTSKHNSQGASLQEDETDILEADDCTLLEETLATQISRYVIAWTFGPGTPVLAYLKFQKGDKQNVDQDLKIDQFLLDAGAPLETKTTLERYGRPTPESVKDGDLLQPPQPQLPPDPAQSELANEVDLSQLEEHAQPAYAAAVAADLQAFRERVAALLEIDDDNIFRERALDLKNQIEKLKKDILKLPKSAQVIAETQFAALFTGLTEADKRKATT